MNIKNQQVLILGLGVSGRAAAEFLLRRKAHVTGIDQRLVHLESRGQLDELKEQGLKTLDTRASIDPKQFDLAVVSPGIPKTDRLYQAALDAGIEVVGEMELACRFISKKVIAITGTNGKTTTTLLAAHALNANGKKARALGNIGIPLIDEIDGQDENPEEIFVVEMSSFQLETLRSPVVDAGVILNITPDHLDRYVSMQEYASAKIRLKDCLKKNGKLIVEESCNKAYRALFGARQIWTYGYTPECSIYCDGESVYLHGRKEWNLPSQYKGCSSHDIENWMAAFAVCNEMGIDGPQFAEAAVTFKKPSHRVEFVRTACGVEYYDDSKGTNLDAVLKAVRSLKKKIILIAGGVDKGAPYTPWIEEFEGKVEKVFAIGQSANKIRSDLCHAIPVEICGSLKEAVEKAAVSALPGQVVLLSPGCASFDQFRDYAHRGEEFKKIVEAL